MSRWIFVLKGDSDMSKLREQMLADLQMRGLSPKTQKIYLREVSNYAKHFNKSPEELGEKELKEYLLYLRRLKPCCQSWRISSTGRS